MNLKQRLMAHGRALGRSMYENALGVGIDFEDGCDAFWVLPGEVTSTVPVPAGADVRFADILAAYEAIGRVRERALHVVRHYIATKGIRVDPRPGGEWNLQFDGGVSSSISVGAHLTAVARDTRDVYEVVRACIGNSCVGKVPSRKRVDRYLNTPGPPPDVPPATDGGTPRSTIRQALAWMGVCKAIDAADRIDSAEALKAAAAPTGRIAQTLLRVAERLPDVEASVQIDKHGALSLAFDDGLDHFVIDTRSRTLAREVAADGPTAAGDRLADRCLALNAGRTRVLRAIWRAAAGRGWGKEQVGSFLSGTREIHLGTTRREVAFDAGEALTAALRGATPEAVLRRLFARHDAFAGECLTALREPEPATPIELPDVTLAPHDVPGPPPLPALAAPLIAELDRFADATLRAYMAEDRTIWAYDDRDVYDPASDTWAARADWVRAAEPLLDGDRPHPMAATILLDAGDPRGDALARRCIAATQPHDEPCDAHVELVWRYRHELPDVARKWFLPGAGDDVPFAAARAKLGDPIAIRKQSLDRDETPPASLPPAERDELHREALRWARTDHHWSPPRPENLRAAMTMGWRDVADALEENPYLLSGLLTRDRRADEFDEPGILMTRDVLLLWSRLAPSAFLARIVAAAHTTDLYALCEAAAREAAARKPEIAANVEPALAVYQAWLKDLQVPLAIAWKRCRAAGI